MLKHLLMLIMFSFVLITVKAQEQTPDVKVTLYFNQSPLSEVLEAIEQQTDIRFSYSTTLINVKNNVSIDVNESSLSTVLNKLFKDLEIEYSVINSKKIALYSSAKMGYHPGEVKNKSSKTQYIAPEPEIFTISGYVEDAESGEKLIGANVFDGKTYEGTVTNNFGFFSLSLPAGIKELSTSYIGYQMDVQEVNLDKDITINISLSPAYNELAEIEIVAERQRNIAEESTMSTIEVPVAQIKKIPALLGEVDVLKALQLLPGVQSGGEGQSGLYVRGGSPDQNLILLDGVPVYNVSHLFGFFSVFNADAIKDVKLIKGGYPARYGGRLSSVLEINMKDGNKKEFHGSGSIGIVASKLTLEGPIKTDKTSFIISGRRTYIDLLAKPFISKQFEDEGQEGGAGYYFYDLNAKINHKFSDKDKLYLSFYGGNDKFYFNSKETTDEVKDYTENGLGWGNVTSALRWNHLWTPKLFSNATLTYSKYDLDTKVLYGTEFEQLNLKDEISLEYDSGINDVAAKIDFDYLPNPNHFIRFGVSAIRHQFKPGLFNLKNEGIDEISIDTIVGQKDVFAREFDAYVEDDIKVGDKLKVNAGLHFSGFDVGKEFYTSVQPRISARYLISEDKSVKFSYATMRQYVNLLSAEGIGLPTDLWVPTTDKILPQDSWQIAAGYAFKLSDELDMTIEAYYKKMNNLVSFKEGSGLFELTDWQDRITQGKGKSYGAEFFLQKKTGRWNGWIGYTLSWTKRQFDDLNFGNEYPYRFDRRHDISIVGQYQISKGINFSATWVYGTGNAVTLANNNYQIPYPSGSYTYNEEIEYFTEKNNYRMRAYHRFDFGFNFVKKKRKYTRTWSVGAYNTYSRKNPFFIYLETDYGFDPDTGTATRKTTLKQQSIFPIIPYVSYSFDF